MQKEVDLSTNEDERNHTTQKVKEENNLDAVIDKLKDKEDYYDSREIIGEDRYCRNNYLKSLTLHIFYFVNSNSQRPPIYKRHISNTQNLAPTKSKAGPSPTAKGRHKNKFKSKR